MKPKTFICLHQVQRNRIAIPAGGEITLEDQVEIDRLLELGAICEPDDFEPLARVPASARAAARESNAKGAS